MERHNNFDLLRLVAATSVIFSHAFFLAEGTQDHDPLMIATDGQSILGLAGVFVFFTISGYLISQSFDATPNPLVFLAKRALRIFPGLLACLIMCVFVVGPLTTALPLVDYLSRPGTYLYLLHNAVLHVDYNRLPGVAFGPGDVGGIVNGPLWSLPCEALLYLLLFALGSLRLLGLPAALAMLAIGLVSLFLDTARMGEGPWGGTLWLMGFFAAGMCCYHLHRQFGDRFIDGRLAVLALAGLVASVPLHAFLIVFAVCGGYLTIWLALTPRLPVIPGARFGDFSYGLYIYGWPVEQLVVYFGHGAAPWWVVFVIAMAVTLPLAYLSWHLVEKRSRLRTRRPSPVVLSTAEVAAGG